MKEVSKDDLPAIQGGADQPATIVDTLPYQVPAPAPTATADGSLLPPTLPEKHVEA